MNLIQTLEQEQMNASVAAGSCLPSGPATR